jgi:hypothetical protein
MFKLSFLVVFAFLLKSAAAQPIVLIKTGRPMPLQYNNAERIVADSWGFSYVYIATDPRKNGRTDSIRQQNQLNEARLVALKGADWKKQFNEALQKQLQINDEIYQLILTPEEYPDFVNKVFYIHIEKHRRSKHKYIAYRFRINAIDEIPGFYVSKIYRINYKSKKFRVLKNKSPHQRIHFSYVENGIE